MIEERWVKVAMTDDAMVADILLCLRQPDSLPLRPVKTLQLDWSVRQRRSRPPLIKNDGGESATRASPTTPLSWSGGTSVSGGGADGADESSSRPATTARPFDDARSKGLLSNEITTTTKRSRKKKTLVELREEESSLSNERSCLKTELMNLRVTVEKHRASNESLKRMKLSVQSQQTIRKVTTSVVSEEAIPNEVQKMEEARICPSTNLPTGGYCNKLVTLQTSTSDCPDRLKEAGNKEAARCLLPDLNIPIEELESEVLYGLS